MERVEAAAGTGPGGTCSLCLRGEAQGPAPPAAGESSACEDPAERLMLGMWPCPVHASHSPLLPLLDGPKSPSLERGLYSVLKNCLGYLRELML